MICSVEMIKASCLSLHQLKCCFVCYKIKFLVNTVRQVSQCARVIRTVLLFSSSQSASTLAGAGSLSGLCRSGSQNPHQTGRPETRAQRRTENS